MKKRVDALRNDIVILKNKDKDEMRSVHNRIHLDDTISQLPASVQDRLGREWITKCPEILMLILILFNLYFLLSLYF